MAAARVLLLYGAAAASVSHEFYCWKKSLQIVSCRDVSGKKIILNSKFIQTVITMHSYKFDDYANTVAKYVNYLFNTTK